jgi:hypothetical protein
MSSFFYGIVGVAVFVAISPTFQLLVRRVAPSMSPVVVLAVVSLTVHIATSALGAASSHSFQYWNATSIFCFGVMSYTYLFGAVYKSISLQILLDLTSRPHRTIEFSEISDKQIPEIFVERGTILKEGQLVVVNGDRFSVTPAGQKLTDRVALIRRLFAIGDTGLYDFDRTKHKRHE